MSFQEDKGRGGVVGGEKVFPKLKIEKFSTILKQAGGG
jgi:hypothetical protein